MPRLFNSQDTSLSAFNLEANAYLRGRLDSESKKIDYVTQEPESFSRIVSKPYYNIEKYIVLRTIVESIAESIDSGRHIELVTSTKSMEDDSVIAMMIQLALDENLLLVDFAGNPLITRKLRRTLDARHHDDLFTQLCEVCASMSLVDLIALDEVIHSTMINTFIAWSNSANVIDYSVMPSDEMQEKARIQEEKNYETMIETITKIVATKRKATRSEDFDAIVSDMIERNLEYPDVADVEPEWLYEITFT